MATSRPISPFIREMIISPNISSVSRVKLRVISDEIKVVWKMYTITEWAFLSPKGTGKFTETFWGYSFDGGRRIYKTKK